MYISPALRHLNATWEGGLERLRPPRRAGERGGNGAHAAQHMLEQHSNGARASPQQNMQEPRRGKTPVTAEGGRRGFPEAENRDWFDDMKYNERDLQWILSKDSTAKENCVVDDKDLYHANDIIKKKMNNFKGWKCSAGIESLMINWDGEVHRATCRVGGSLGNIYNGSFEEPEQEIICTRQWCTCAADIPLTKISI